MEDELTVNTLFDQTLISLAHNEISLIFIISSPFGIKGIKVSFGQCLSNSELCLR